MKDLIALEQAGIGPTTKHPNVYVCRIEQLQAFADLIRKESEAERDRLRVALTEMMEFAGIIEERCDSYATNLARQALEEAR